MHKQTTVFISSRFEEFSDLRKKILDKNFGGLSKIGLILNMLDHRKDIADSRSPAIASIEEASNADIFVLLLGETYSTFLNNDEKSYTHLEYEAALSRGMKILAFPIGDCYNPHNEKLSSNPLFQQLQKNVLRNEIHTTAPYTPSSYDIDELYEKIYNSLQELIKQVINKNLLNHYEPCPYDAQILYKNQDFLLKTISDKINTMVDGNLKNKLLTEKKGNENLPLPTIILIDKEIGISDTISHKLDTNHTNEYFINELKDKCGKELWNNPTYRLVKIDNSELVLGKSDYYKTLSTCDIHYYNFINKNNNMLENSNNYKKWITQLENIIYHNKFTDISASLGCSTLLVVKNHFNNKFQYYIVNNSKTKNGNSTKHVVPSFMFQPTKMIVDDDDFKSQSDVLSQVLKEFAEELLGMEELEHINDYQVLHYKMDKNKVIKHLKKLLNNGKAIGHL